jgi:lipooligosaccharide transport system permease protein
VSITRTVDGTRPSGPPALVRSYAHWWYAYKRVWRGSVVTTVLVPVLNLLALGYGLGALVDAGGGFDGLSYVAFIGPGLLATSAMTTAVEETTFPVMGAIRWDRSYHAMMATPLGARDVLVGHLLWVLTRVLSGSAVFFAVLVAFGVVDSWTSVVAIPFALLLGFAFAAPVMAFAATTENNERFALLYRFGVIPLFLFAGAFFPVTQLPGWMQVVAHLTPTYHGVELCRGATTDTLAWGSTLVSVAYLLLWGAIGFVLAVRAYHRRLVV